MLEIKPKEKSSLLARIKVVGVVVVVLMLFVYFLVLPAVENLEEALRHRDCVNHCKQIALAMHDYHDKYETFPPAHTTDANGKPSHSWRTLLLPFLECEAMYHQIRLDEPWDSEYNRQFHNRMPKVFSCWNLLKHFRNDKENSGQWSNRMTAWQVVVGPDTLFPGSQCRTLHDVTRGKSDTAMVVESTAGVCWMAPLDLPFEALEHGVVSAKSGILGIGSYHNSGVNAAMANGNVDFFPNSQSLEDVKMLKERVRIKLPTDGADSQINSTIPE